MDSYNIINRLLIEGSISKKISNILLNRSIRSLIRRRDKLTSKIKQRIEKKKKRTTVLT